MTYVARKIDYFIAVAQEGSLTAAANKRFVTVPPVCKLIAELEEVVGKKLFSRKGRGMELTDEGKKLYNALITPYNTINEAFLEINAKKVVRFDIYGPFPTFLEDICHYNFRPESGSDIEVTRKRDADDKDKVSNADFIYRTSSLNNLVNFSTIMAKENAMILHSCNIKQEEVFNLPFIQNPNLAETDVYKQIHNKLVLLGYNDKVISIDNEDLRRDIVRRGDGISLITQSFVRAIHPDKLNVLEVEALCGVFTHYIYIKNSGLVSYESIRGLLSSISYLDWE